MERPSGCSCRLHSKSWPTPPQTSEGRMRLLSDSPFDRAEPPLRTKGFIPHVSSLCLASEQTVKIVTRARENGTSLQGLLCAALVLAGWADSEARRKGQVRILSPINLRGLVGFGMQSILAIGVTVLRAEPTCRRRQTPSSFPGSDTSETNHETLDCHFWIVPSSLHPGSHPNAPPGFHPRCAECRRQSSSPVRRSRKSGHGQ